jgi:ATP-GRASP peptide maturase of grasp-with-spasm system
MKPTILILSQSAVEGSTEAVIDHLIARGVRYVRLNGDDIDASKPFGMTLSLAGTELRLTIDDTQLDPGEVSAVWFRRWQFEDPFREKAAIEEAGKVGRRFATGVVRHLQHEMRRLSEFLFSLFSGASWLTEPEDTSINKLTALATAAEVGLDIPRTLVTTSRDELSSFLEQHGRVITKAVSEGQYFVLDGRVHLMYTTELDAAAVAELPPQFFPALFQECLQKQYELRVFYLDGRQYAAAIFSQSDKQTQTDFRRYNFARPNRVVPYQLPAAVSEQIEALMRKLPLETGSLDLVKTVDGRYVFLEVNPVGQFGMISEPCNFHLERIVAEHLCRKAGHGEAD